MDFLDLSRASAFVLMRCSGTCPGHAPGMGSLLKDRSSWMNRMVIVWYASILSAKKRIVIMGISSKGRKFSSLPKCCSNISILYRDPSIRFHRKPKGGYTEQPKILEVLPNGRPKDQDALGYNVLFHYPQIQSQPVITEGASPTVQLVEAIMVYCYTKKIPHLVAYSRPLLLSRYFQL